MLKLTDSQWAALVKELEEWKRSGTLASAEWTEKAKQKTLTLSELAYINLVLLGRTKP